MDLLRNPGSRLALDSFCKDTTFGKHTIKTLYLYADRYNGVCIIKDNPGLYRDFIAWAHSQGYKVYALVGSSMYCAPMYAYDRYHDKAVALMENIINFNISSAANERFDGINVDIEPYGLPDWKSKPVVQVQFLNMLDKMIQRKNAAGINLAFGPAVPRWLDESRECARIKWGGSTKWEGNHIQDICDYIVVMDYRDVADGPSGIIRHGQGEIDYANIIGKPRSVLIGVETDDCASTGDPECVTFREEGRTSLETELAKVYSTWGGSASFGGCAIHHYDSFRALPSAWGAPPARRSPADSTAPSAVRGTPIAETFDYQRIDLAYGYATGNTAMEGCNIYRSTTSGFTSGPFNLVACSRQSFFKDSGLLPNTTYYYKIAAVDIHGKIGPATPEVSATTGITKLIPVRIARLDLRYAGKACTVTLKIVNNSTGEGVAVAVHGRFTYMGGKYQDMKTAPDGTASATLENIESPHGKLGFSIDRIIGKGYYWASSSDTPHTSFCTW
jgi:hypothetical protein